MGIGRYKDGKFDLVLSVRHAADASRIAQWERSWKRASEILFDATDGQMQFGRLYVANNSRGSSEADAWLMSEEGTSFSNVLALGDSGLHMTLKGDERNKPFVIIHEFGHYGLGLYDEYTGPSGDAECTGSTADGACIMEHGYWNGDQISDAGVLTTGTVNEFCVESNHDPDNDTNQQAIHGEACWTTLHGNYPDVTVPTGLPNAPTPTGHDPVQWSVLADEARFSLLLDRSGSMSKADAISGVRFGADYWIDLLAHTDDRLSVIAYNHANSVILPSSLVSAITPATVTAAIDALTPAGRTNIGGAISEGISQIGAPGDRAATQVMVLFSDGLHNTGTAPMTYVDQLVEKGIRLYTVGFGPDADQATLQQLAEATGGRFEQIDAPSTGSAQLDIQNYLIEISGEVRDGSGIITMSPGLLPEPAAGELAEVAVLSRLKHTAADLLAVAGRPLAFRLRGAGFDHKAYVEAGAKRAVFVLSHEAARRLSFYVVRPDGRVVSPSDPDVTLVDVPDKPYAFYIVRNPAAGHWVMRVLRAQNREALRFKVFAFSENPAITTGVKGIRALLPRNRAAPITAQAFHHVALTGITLPQLVVRPAAADVVPRVGLPAPLLRRVAMNPVAVRPVAGLPRARVPLDGLYRGDLTFNRSGSYSVELQFINTGRATEAFGARERARRGDRNDVTSVPAFQRVRRFQLHVGRLPAGRDSEP